MNFRRILIAAVAFLPIVVSSWVAHAERFTIEDALAIKTIGDVQWAPGGEALFFTIREWKPKDNSYVTHIYRVLRSGGKVDQLTRGDGGETNPRVSPDGTMLAFSASRGEEGAKSQIWILPLQGGEAYPLTEEEGVSDFSWAPNGRHLAFTTLDPLPDTEEREKKKKEKFDEVIVDEGFRWTHLSVIELESREKKRLTHGDFNAGEPRWSPDGQRIAFTASYIPHQESSWVHRDVNREIDIFLISAQGGNTDNLTPKSSRAANPRWSPDGKRLSFGESEDVKVWPSFSNLMVLDLQSREAVEVTQGERDSFADAIWSIDGKDLYFSMGKGVYTHFYNVGSMGGEIQRTSGGTGILGSAFALSPDGGFVAYSANDPSRPGDIWVSKVDGSAAARITDVNPQIGEFETADSKAIRWKTADGWVEGVLMLPLDYREGERYPLILQIHGGPYGRFSHTFSPRDQIFAANGYTILKPNPRGSTGYGFEFTIANVGDWGGKDFHVDDLSGVDHVIEQGIADPDRLVVMGGSYGGFSTFWAITQTNRFQAAIGHAGIVDWYSFHGQTSIPGLLEYGFEGYPWEVAETYRKFSPITFVKDVSTPILITHGERDRTVPIAQAEQYYTALKKLGVKVQFVRYPREGHGIREPNHVIDLVHRQLEWFDQHLGIARGRATGKP